MTTAVQRRRGTSTEHSTFTGLNGEITVNTTTYTAHIHDGATAGGVPLAKADGSNIVTSSIDINGGTIDGTVIGGTTPAAVTTSSLVATTADINAGTIDGTVIGGTTPAAGTFTTGQFNTSLNVAGSDAALAASIGTDAQRVYITPNGTVINYNASGDSAGSHLFQTGNVNRLNIASNGDISFYEDTGTTAKFFWDASDETISIGTGTSSTATISAYSRTVSASLPSALRIIENTGASSYWDIGSTGGASNNLNFYANANTTPKMTLTGSGNVGIGTSSPQASLTVAGGLPAASSPATYAGTIQINETALSTLQEVGGLEFRGAVFGSGYGSKITGTDTGSLLFGRRSNNVSWSESMRIDSSGNLLLAGTGTPTSSVGNLVLYNGTAPTGNATNGVILYAEDVSASSELKVRDEAGNVTTLSPHNFDLIPEGPSEDMAWSYYSERDGKRINVDMLKAIRLLEQISGEKLVHMV
jgi:hypothetical protein